MLLRDIPEESRPTRRVIGKWRGERFRKGEIAATGVLNGIDVVYLTWDQHGPLPASSDTVVASSLLVLDAG